MSFLLPLNIRPVRVQRSAFHDSLRFADLAEYWSIRRVLNLAGRRGRQKPGEKLPHLRRPELCQMVADARPFSHSLQVVECVPLLQACKKRLAPVWRAAVVVAVEHLPQQRLILQVVFLEQCRQL